MALANQPAKAPAADLTEGLSGPAASPNTPIVAGDAPIAIPQASLLFDAGFVRSGDDLTLVGHDGQELLIVDYFGAGAPDLIAPNHAMLDGQTVTLLAGPQFPWQYAQAGGATQPAEPIGSVETLQGAVTAQRADGTTQELKVGDPVFESDVIATGPGANIGMKLADGTLVTLQESGKLAINEFVYQADGADNSALLNVIQGTFSLFAGQVAPTGDMLIKTPIATMGIRGTSILGVNVDAILGRLSLTQDPDGHVGFIEIFNNQNGNLFTVLRTVFEKITVSESGLLSITPKTPEELGIDQTLTELLHNFYNQVPQQGPDTSPQPQTGSPFFETPNIQEIIFDPAGPQDGAELLLPQELLEQFLESLLGIKEIRDEIILALSENPTAGQVILDDQLEADAEAGEGGDPVETTLPFDFGSSGPGSVGFAALDGQPVVDANDQPVTNDDNPLVYVWDPATNTLTAVVQGEDGELGETVFTIEVNPTTGEVTVTINGSLDHFAPNGEFLPIDIPFTVQAANGATATGTLTVVVGDDVPAFSNPDGDAPGVSNAIVDEDDGGGGPDDATATGNLKVDFGADGFGETVFTAFQVPNGESGELVAGGEGVDSGLTSNGEAILFRLSADGQTIEGYVPGENGQEQVILRATLDGNDAGYEVELLGNIDHQPPNDTNNRDDAQSIKFTVAATDGDGDSIEATLSVQIDDDAPDFSNPEGSHPGVSNAVLDEADADGPQGDVVTGTLKVDFGADGFGETAFTGAFEVPNEGSGVLEAGGQGLDSGLTSGGETIMFRLSQDGQTIEGYVAGENGEEIILRATLDESDRGYEVELLGNIDHRPGSSGQSINFKVAASDYDGDSIEVDLSARIKDGEPEASNDLAVAQAGGGNKNLVIMIDVSGSMAGERLELAKQAAINLINGSNLNQVMVVAFAGLALPNLPVWTGDKADAAEFINGLSADGGTSYESALTVAAALHNAGQTSADETEMYFFSDGGDTIGDGAEFVWKLILAENGVDKVTAVGVGDGDFESLDSISFNLNDFDGNVVQFWHAYNQGHFDGDSPVHLTDQFDLVNTISGNVLTVDSGDGVDDFGADGGEGVASLVVDGTTYTPEDGNILEVTTLQGGKLVFNFATGDWEYLPAGDTGPNVGQGYGDQLVDYVDYSELPYGQPPSLPYENFRYTIQDGDGDTSTASLTIVTDPETVDQVYQGGEGNDVLDEGAVDEVDVLVGGLGADKFVLNSFEVSDFIADYNVGEGDEIDLTGLLEQYNGDTGQNISATDFLNSVSYDSDSGQLSVDPGGNDPTVVATLGNTPSNVTIIVDDGSTQQSHTIA